MSQVNDFGRIAKEYRGTNTKPDKLFSILPTVIRMVGDVRGKSVLDIGCGSGFFTEAILHLGAKQVYGIDIAGEQIKLAKASRYAAKIHYSVGDMFTAVFPKVDVVLAPFVLNYAQSVEQLEDLMTRFATCLNPEGVLIAVIDLPSGADLSRFGARKSLPAGDNDAATLEIRLFNEGVMLHEPIVAWYYRPETVEQLTIQSGLRTAWEKPVIASEGVAKYGVGFWEGYLDNPELGYLKGRKT